MPDFGSKKAYRPRWQETPGYKTVVDVDSEKGIFPAETESKSVDRGQGNMDAMWPVELPQSREKERALPLPSNHDKKREKRVGPTNYIKPRHIPYRTQDVPGEEYGHPTKYDYNWPRRRNETLASDDELDFTGPPEDTIEVEGAGTTNKGPFPVRHQKNQGGSAKLYSRSQYRRQKALKKLKEKREYKKERRQPKFKLKKRYMRTYPRRYKRRGIDPRTHAQKSKDWREEQARKPKSVREREERGRRAGLELLSEVMGLLGMEMEGADWPVDWNTQVKKTEQPEQLDQNYGNGQGGRGSGTPRKDPNKQKGESLRAPDLSGKPQVGLKWEIEPSAPGGLDYPLVTTMNPTDGSGKVIPMSWYTDEVNNTQAVPDGRQDRYLHNNNFEVKQGHGRVAYTVGEILQRCDHKIRDRSREYTPRLARTDTKNWVWHWRVGEHVVKVQAFKRGRAENFTKLNLRVSCSCPYWRWWGPEHWGSKSDYQRGPLQGTGAYPAVRDPARWRPVCKHAYAVLEKSQKFFVRPEKHPLRRLAARFFVDRPEAVEVEFLQESIAARVARRHLERQISRRVASRYVEREES